MTISTNIVNTTSIVIIIPWFGKWPVWIDAFLLTCGKNSSITFLIPTDAPFLAAPTNVLFLSCTMSLVSERLTELFNSKFDLKNPYKICDAKPILGLLFKEEIKEYHFWGHADLDVVWGDIRKFIPEQLLNLQDIICGSASGIIGHFTIYRNTKQLNYHLKSMPFFKQMLQSEKSFFIDEFWCNAWTYNNHAGFAYFAFCKFIYSILQKNIFKMFFKSHQWYQLLFLKLLYQSRDNLFLRILGIISRSQFRIYSRQLHKSGAEMIANKTLTFQWDNGRLLENNDKEWMYLHFHYYKKLNPEINFSLNNATNNFVVNGTANSFSVLSQ